MIAALHAAVLVFAAVASGSPPPATAPRATAPPASAPSAIAPPATVPAVAPPSATAPSVAPMQLLIVHPASLADAAREWRDHRAAQGWRVTLIEWNGGEPEALRALVRERIGVIESAPANRPMPPRRSVAILLLGDVPGKGVEDGLPTFRIQQPDRRLQAFRDAMFASDGPYQDLDDDGVPDVMLGRVAVSTPEAARAFLAKIRAAESAPPSEASCTVEVVGGEGHFGPYDALLEVLTSALFLDSVPPEFSLRVSYAKATSPFCPPPSSLSDIAREQALGGALLFNYIGHGHAEGLDRLFWGDKRLRILDTSALGAPGAAPGATAPAVAAPGGVALLVCCETGWYDLPGKECFAEALLRQPTGPIAVIAGSRPTHPYANAIIEREGVRRLIGDRPATVGEWDLAVTRAMATLDRDALDLIAAPIAAQQTWPLSLKELRRQHAQLYNLLGDPATRLVHPPARAPGAITLSPDGTLDGSIPGAGDATATITIVERRRPTRPEIEPAPPGAADLEDRARRNWPRANEWTLWRSEVPVVDGRFSAKLPMPLPERASHAVVKVTAGGVARGANAADRANATDRANTADRGNATDRANAAGDSTSGARALRLLQSIDLAPLVRSGADGKGLPPDRGSQPRGTRATAR